ncbi:MAG: RNA polymerase subunit sigma [Polyangiaceae bacterium]|nr:RNA polymerase subunit sigma [Myxococcales bacterium]MCB9584645.1 RNA polymerase subunit sigma [Polyangiaceae bacterium]MCB9609082.1 RNA polymerase subunit sigma [Polyangiaceae bacterium]
MVATQEGLSKLLERAATFSGPVVFLTGAGISQESGIPTFRGAEGYWRVGSKNYHPMELATFAAYSELREEIWGWYLYRRAVCAHAEPNLAHRAIAALEQHLGDGLLLITQNVDGLHLRAGSSRARTFEIHGDINRMRCEAACSDETFEISSRLIRDPALEKQAESYAPSGEELQLLRCPRCGGNARPHVLWFDEYYNEEHFRFESSMRAAASARLLVVIGTTGATNLPIQIGRLVAARGAPLLVLNPEPNPFSDFAEQCEGVFLQGTAGALVPDVCTAIAESLGGRR